MQIIQLHQLRENCNCVKTAIELRSFAAIIGSWYGLLVQIDEDSNDVIVSPRFYRPRGCLCSLVPSSPEVSKQSKLTETLSGQI